MIDAKQVGGRRPSAPLRSFLGRMAGDRSGAAAVFFAVCLLLLAPLALGLVNIYLATNERSRLQDALDAAALYVARTNLTDATEIRNTGKAVLLANLGFISPEDQRKLVNSDFVLANSKIVSSAEMLPPDVGPNVFHQGNIKANSEVTRNSVNLEVAIVLDTTGSMNYYIPSLKTAAKDLVDLVVKDTQEPYYSKAALVPYSVGVNVGSTYANTVRGAPRGATNVTGVSKSNSRLTVTSANHGLSDGEWVTFSGVKGMTQLNGNEYVVSDKTTDAFKLKNSSGQYVSTSGYSNYTSGGTVQCKGYRCATQKVKGADNVYRDFTETTCATERTGAEQYTDAAPSTRLVGAHYRAASNPGSNTECKSQEIVPLTATKKTLKDKIDLLSSDGFTAGQIGLAWGWYMVSPKWNQVFTGTKAPAAYDKPETMKVVVLMTDGAFNTGYCNGVIGNDSTDSKSSDQNTCNAENGSPFTQAEKLCKNIKDQKIVLYTVGFNIGEDGALDQFLDKCATDSKHYYKPASGDALKDAFKAIGQDINRLRISK